MAVSSPYFDPDYENFNEKINGPRVTVDNESCKKCTVVKVDSLNKQDLLLEAVEVLTDKDLFITKGYISSDAGWFMDVFHVKDQKGNKVTDKNVINYLQQALGTRRELQKSRKSKKFYGSSNGCTAIEIIGINRPGLFSEISAVLAEERCNVIEAHVWSHNSCLACVAYVSDESTSTCIDDPNRLSLIEDHLSTILGESKHDCGSRGVKTRFLWCANTMSHAERRLHQLMLANRDFDRPSALTSATNSSRNMQNCKGGKRTIVSIDKCSEKGYSMVYVESLDRTRLMFDTVCTLIDMQYVIFHANFASHGRFAHQEYFIRHKDGNLLESSDEAHRVAKCLEAAIERRLSEGVRLELDAESSVEALPYFTRTLREHGLTVSRADISAHGQKAKNIFYVEDISGKEVDLGIVESMKKEFETLDFQVKDEMQQPQLESAKLDSSSFVSLVKSHLRDYLEALSAYRLKE